MSIAVSELADDVRRGRPHWRRWVGRARTLLTGTPVYPVRPDVPEPVRPDVREPIEAAEAAAREPGVPADVVAGLVGVCRSIETLLVTLEDLVKDPDGLTKIR